MGEDGTSREQPPPGGVVDRDSEHLRLLSIFYYIAGGLTACFACIPFIHVGLGLVMVLGGFEGPDGPPAAMGWLFVVLGAMAIILGWTFAGLFLYTGRCLGGKKHYVFCIVVAALSCLQIPLGTVLGVFTIVVLARPSVKELFASGQLPQASQAPTTQ